ncbi:MAG: DNA polymerase III subunit beta [Phocaeicola sp.]
MNFTISKSELYNKLKSIGKVIQPKNATPAYNNFLFEFNQDCDLTITAGEDAGRISVQCAASTDSSNFAFMVDAKSLLDGVSNLAEQPLVFNLSNSILTCTYHNGKGEFEIPFQSGDEYPTYNIDSKEEPISIPSKMFLYGFSKVSFCTADDELRPVLNGVYFDQDGESVSYVASDGNALALAETRIEGLTGKLSFITPTRFARLLQSIIAKETDTVSISISSVNIIISFGDYNIVCRMIEGRYPNYRSVIPKTYTKLAKLNRTELLSALKRVCVFSSKNTSLLIMQKSNSDSLILKCSDIDFGMKAEENAPIESWEGENICIGFNSKFLIPAIHEMPCDSISIEFTDSSRPALIRRTDETPSTLTYLIMPMQIND